MTELEKLIELIKPYMSGLACGDESGACELTNCRDCRARNCANDLLANGVIVPPCKVGDTVYTISRGRPKKWKVCFIGQNTQEEQKYHLADEGYKHMIEAWNYDIGKTVFLSREDAEKALKEREDK